MRIEFDPAKNEANVAKHGIDLASAWDLEFDTALVSQDVRWNYGEPRYIAIGYIDARLHVLIFTKRGQSVRAIGLRKANRRETRAYHEKTKEA